MLDNGEKNLFSNDIHISIVKQLEFIVLEKE
jgi:hypothetical protein